MPKKSVPCERHPEYKGKTIPVPDCHACWNLYSDNLGRQVGKDRHLVPKPFKKGE
jgi:hypothetical protein